MERNFLIFTATYNEIDNIGNLIPKIFYYIPGAEILVIDDSSPDGTGKLLDSLSEKNNRIRVVHRPFKMGLGTAHLFAMKYAIENNFNYLITMDADFSHDPKYLIQMQKLSKNHDFVIGSRYIEGGGCEYGLIRTFISRTANYLARILLGIPTHETTTSYRCFSVNLLRKKDLTSIRSGGYSFFIESIFEVSKVTSKIAEFPIYFADRRSGKSKISKREIFKALLVLLRLFIQKISTSFMFIKSRSNP